MTNTALVTRLPEIPRDEVTNTILMQKADSNTNRNRTLYAKSEASDLPIACI